MKHSQIAVKLMENKKNINHMEYVLAGDYYIPELKLPHEKRPSENTDGCTESIRKSIAL